MSDIVDRLRQGVDPDNIQETEAAMDKGADEIERLRGIVQFGETASRQQREGFQGEIARLKAALQLAQRWAGEAADALQPSAEENMRLRAEVERLTAALDRLRAAYNNKEISGSLWDKEQQCHQSLPVFFEHIARAALERK